MSSRSPQDPTLSSTPSPRATRVAAFGVHIFTALGAGVALLAMMQAAQGRWTGMFCWLGVALAIDGLDGPLARRMDVIDVLPDWSGDSLDFVVDFITYVFVPAYAIAASGLLMTWTALLLGVAIVVSSALYFADTRMKTSDNYFRGFPALWNAAAFYLFLLQPSPWLASLLVAVVIVLTFVPIRVIHPVRVTRWRAFNLALVAIWAVLAMWTLLRDFHVAMPVVVALSIIAFYVLFADTIIRLIRPASS